MTTLEEIAKLAAEQQALWQDYDTPHEAKRERLGTIADKLAQLYARKNQEAADRRATLEQRARR